MQVSVRNLAVAFQGPNGTPLPALGPVTFRIESGQIVCLVGPSGCGKSTLVRVLAGLLPPTQGQAFHGDTLIGEPSPSVGLMFQQANLMPWRTVLDNVALPLEIAGTSKEKRHRAAQSLLNSLGLSDFANAYPGELSGGMAQRVALGRVLSQQPDVLLLDEPFGALDAITREQISFDLLRARQGQTVLMVTHDIQEAVLLADRVLVMSQRPGRIVADIAVPLNRPRQPDDVYTQDFIGTARQVRSALSAP